MIFETGPIENIWSVLLNNFFCLEHYLIISLLLIFHGWIWWLFSCYQKILRTSCNWQWLIPSTFFFVFFCCLYILFSSQHLKNAFYCHQELKAFVITLAYLTKYLLCSYHILATRIIDYIKFLRIIAIHNLVS